MTAKHIKCSTNPSNNFFPSWLPSHFSLNDLTSL